MGMSVIFSNDAAERNAQSGTADVAAVAVAEAQAEVVAVAYLRYHCDGLYGSAWLGSVRSNQSVTLLREKRRESGICGRCGSGEAVRTRVFFKS